MTSQTSEFSILHDVPQTMRDGTVLRADVYRPGEPDRSRPSSSGRPTARTTPPSARWDRPRSLRPTVTPW
jgi:predicted acyl esterase